VRTTTSWPRRTAPGTAQALSAGARFIGSYLIWIALRSTYLDNLKLSEARAKMVAGFLDDILHLPASASTATGKGEAEPLVANDSAAHMALNRRTTIHVSYDETDTAAPVAPTVSRKLVAADACAPAAPSNQPFAISVDGQPVGTLADGTSRHEADRQRCVDVALDRSAIQIKYDPMNLAPALNAWAVPGAVRRGQDVVVRTYANYAWWVKKAEIRLFGRGQSTVDRPLAILPVEIGGDAHFTAPNAGAGELGFVLRVYDAKGRFDETALKAVELLGDSQPDPSRDRIQRDAQSGYGENALRIRNIGASGGAVTISGKDIKPGESVKALGMPVPVDDHGRFVFRQILPPGPHSVAVAVREADGREASFQRDLSISPKDFFYVALADITAAHGQTTGPAAIVTGDDYHYSKSTTFDGRLAFYAKGKLDGKTLLTASADTEEQPLKNLFSNFGAKDPYYLLRRIDPNRFYPVYGDDGTIVDDAPTQGKFYVKLERGASSAMWGNFQTSWTGTELTQYSRGLYGADVLFNSRATTAAGERRTQIEGFAAEPGTLESREEFRGTGGSLYYLHHQDLTEGSERLWVEIRDKDSGIVLQRNLLAASQDYDIDYLQGRLTLRAPLPTVADGSELVQTSTFNGNPVFLVTTYEYVPGLTAVHGSTVGVRGSQWLTNNIRIGGTYYKQGEDGYDQHLAGVDATLRYKPGTWIRGEGARSKGAGGDDLSSNSGGFDFTQNVTPNRAANAYRFDSAIDLSDLGHALNGKITAYYQDRQSGFSAPGLTTPGGEAMRQGGASAIVPIGRTIELALKGDDRHQDSLSSQSEEIALRAKLSAKWGVSAGVRHDDYETGTDPSGALLNASPYLTRNGERTDAIIRFDFRPLAPGQHGKAAALVPAAKLGAAKYGTANGNANLASGNQIDTSGPAASLLANGVTSASGKLNVDLDSTVAAGIAAAEAPGMIYRPWNIYGFVQQTISASGQRLDNDRVGIGGGWRLTKRIRLSAEVSGGNQGAAGKLGADYAIDDRSTLYFTYARETEVPDLNYAGAEGILSAGGRMRLNERLNIFAEERETSGEGQHSLTHGFGVDFAPWKNWTTGLRFERGSVQDPISGDLKRDAVSLTLGYKNSNFKWLSLAEYRHDRSDTLGTAAGTCTTGDLTTGSACTAVAGLSARNTILLKNSLSYQINPAWRILGTLNLSHSTSSQGDYYDGNYTEAVLGAAYRPVKNDKLNLLFKYTYFYNLPSTGQVDSTTNSLLDYTQKSHVLDVDGIYDLFPWLSLGAKFGMRIGELRDSRTNGGNWYSSRADLIVARADIHFVRQWDALAEYRMLRVHEADDHRSGVLVGIYRHVGGHAKIGVGYNFTNFSDDLTDLSYRSHGFFINALATF
jgi:hypothetical protein